MTRDEAVAWFKSVPNGTHAEREAYKDVFGVGRVVEPLLHDPTFTLGVEYGIRMALARIFALQPEDV